MRSVAAFSCSTVLMSLLAADFPPKAIRSVDSAEGLTQAAEARHAAPEPVEPVTPPTQSDPAAVKEAVQQTRAEMGNTNLMQRGERE